MNIKIIKSKTRKRSIQISIDKNRQITVKAPFKTKDSEIEKFLKEHKDWIEKTLSKIKPQESLTDKNLFMLLGKQYSLSHKVGRIPKGILPAKSLVYRDKAGSLYIWGEQAVLKTKESLEIEDVKQILQKFYKKFGKEYSLIKSKEYADLINKSFNRISIKDVNTRWGSCSTKNNLNYNYRLFMAPKEVIDYVIAHEVSHLKHRNHSSTFWNCVEQIYPNYKNCRKWLKKNGHLLVL